MNTKKRLIASLLAMAMCFTMLVGSTFAWFTDNASTGVNTIQAGTLRVDLVDEANNSLEGKSLTFKKAGNNELWEPGQTWTLQDVFVKNNGNLALKYRITITGIQGDAELNEVITWTIKVGDETVTLTNGVSQEFKLAANTQSPLLSISGHMDEKAGNQYQGKKIDGISIKVEATQDTVEHDSQNNTYDEDAQYGEDYGVKVASAEELQAALATGDPVKLTTDIELTEALAVTNNAAIELDGNTLTVKNNTSDAIAVSDGATLTISNGELTFAIEDPSYTTTYDAISVTNDTAGTTSQINLNNVKVTLDEPATDWNDGGIHVSATAGNAVLNIGEGTVIDTARHAVFIVEGNAIINMAGGEINISNFATEAGYTMGYGIDIAGPNATFNMTGGKINVNADVYTNAFTVEDDNVTMNISGGEINASGSNTKVIEKYGQCNPTITIADGVVNLTNGAELYR